MIDDPLIVIDRVRRTKGVWISINASALLDTEPAWTVCTQLGPLARQDTDTNLAMAVRGIIPWLEDHDAEVPPARTLPEVRTVGDPPPTPSTKYKLKRK